MFAFGILATVSGVGWNYFGKKITELKSVEQKQNNEETTKQIIDTIFTQSERIVDEVKKGDRADSEKNSGPESRTKDNVEKKPDTVMIKAPGAQIVTNNQSGGSNTVINNNLDIPLPTVKFSGWTVQNEIVNEIPKKLRRPQGDSINVKQNFGVDSVYHNQISLLYQSDVNRNQIGFRIRNRDVVKGFLSKSGMLMQRSGIDKEGDFVFVITQPSNGLYTMDIYSKSELINPAEEIDYLK